MSQIKAIKCPKCAAPLTLLGGGRVKTITCSYCKSIIDLDNHFQILGNFQNIKESHALPFEIGMKGVIEGIEYTIIGRVSYVELHNEFYWDDFLLFSPLYGYAWLTYEEGHTIYSKRERTLPLLFWEDINRVESLTIKNQNYRVLPPYRAKINYIEGELTWIAKKYDKIEIIDMYAPPFGISIEKSNNEIEYYRSTYMNNHDVYDAFEVNKEKRVENNNVHELLEYGQYFFKPLFKVSAIMLGLLIVLSILFKLDGQGSLVTGEPDLFDLYNKQKKIEVFNSHPLQKKINIDDNKYLTSMVLRASSAKSLNNFNIQIKDEKKILFSINKSDTYIDPSITTTKSLSLPTWERKAKKVEIYLHLPEGNYSLNVTPVDSNLSSSIEIAFYKNRVKTNYLFYMIGAMILFMIIYALGRHSYRLELEDEEPSFLIMALKHIGLFLITFMIFYYFFGSNELPLPFALGFYLFFYFMIGYRILSTLYSFIRRVK